MRVLSAERRVCQPASRGDRFPGTPDLLHTIRRLGLRCAVVSNVLVRAEEDYRQDLGKLRFDGLVDAFVTSIETRVREPDPRIFDVAMRTMGRRAAELVMVGNFEVNDIEPAIRLGMRSIRGAIEEPPPRRTRANVLATSRFDVAQQLERWSVRPSPS